VDLVSSGDGITEYGSDGYVLFGFQEGNDLTNLPPYIKNVTVHHHDYYGWSPLKRTFVGKSSSNTSYLPDPRTSHKGERALGFFEDTTDVLGRGVIIDVEVDEERLSGSYRLAVYCVAQKPDEKHAMRVVDMKSMNVIAPTKLISNHTKGVWWSVRYDRSLRLRLMGINSASASAVAFGLPGNLLKDDDKQLTTVS
jgi:hypothetical protein